MLSAAAAGPRYRVVAAECVVPLAQKLFLLRGLIWPCTARLKPRPFKTIYKTRSEYSAAFFPIQRSLCSCSSVRQSTRVKT